MHLDGAAPASTVTSAPGMTYGDTMFRRSARRGTGESGFTLLELVIVIGAIAIVMAVLLLGIRQTTQS